MKARNPRFALATVIVEGFLGRLAFGMISFALPLFAYQLGLSFAEIGLLVSLRTVVSLLLKPLAGAAADRWSVRSVYLAGTLGRVLAVAGLLLADGYLALLGVRLLQGVSAAGRDVGSLSVIARDAGSRVGSAYSWYSTAKHIGGVGGAALAGIILRASGGSFNTLFLVVLGLAVLPLLVAWAGLQEERDAGEPEAARQPAPPAGGRLAGSLALARELAAPGSVAMLVTTSAYMVHGIFPILATEYAGLTEAETGIIYSLSAAVFLVAGPTFGWLVDRHGGKVGVGSRAVANIGSSIVYLASPSFAGLAVARGVDDAGKAAFRPAWASVVADVAAADPPRRGRRLAALDTAQTSGEVVGPLLAGILWQTGGIGLMFGVRIAIAVVAEVGALRVFGMRGGGKARTEGRVSASPTVADST